MPAALPLKLRKRIVRAYVEHGMTMREVAKVFDVSYNSVRRCIAKAEEGVSLEPGVPPGSPPKLREQALEWLRTEVESNPYGTTYELTAKFNRAHRSNQVHRSTILRTLRKLGYTYKKNSVRTSA